MKTSLFLALLLCFIFSRSNAQTWTEVGTGTAGLNGNNKINVIASDSSGNIYAAGDFTNSQGYHYVAKWDGTNWTELGSGTSSLYAIGNIRTMVIDKAGNIYVRGDFTNSQDEQYIAWWNGTAWSELPNSQTSSGSSYVAMTLDYAGNLYAALPAISNLKKWNGSSWTPINLNSSYTSSNAVFATDAAGEIYIGSGGDDLYKWNGSVLNRIPANAPTLADNIVYTILADRTGNSYAAGRLYGSNGNVIIKWDGTTKTLLSNGFSSSGIPPLKITMDQGGKVYAYDAIKGGSNRCVSIYNGTDWKDICQPFPLMINGQVNSITVDPDKNIYAGGTLRNASNTYCVLKLSESTPTATKSALNTQTISLFPNPGTGFVSFPALSEDVQVNVSNVLGETVFTKVVGSGSSSIDLSNLPSGLYTILFNGQTVTYTAVKWIKE